MQRNWPSSLAKRGEMHCYLLTPSGSPVFIDTHLKEDDTHLIYPFTNAAGEHTFASMFVALVEEGCINL